MFFWGSLNSLSINCRNFLKTACFAAAICAVSSVSALAAAKSKPNVVFVLTDDQGYGDLSCHGHPVLKTPNIDALHAESIRLTDYHVSPSCSPTRGALMSGHFANRAGPWHTIMGRSMVYEGEHTFGSVFGAQGYATGLFGKWHLGDNYPFRPQDRGFQETVSHGGGGVGNTPDNWDNFYFDDTYNHNGVPEKYQGFCTDVFFSQARRFIEDSVAVEKPFIAYISTNAPHGPFHCPDKYWKPYAPYARKMEDDRLAIFYGMIANIDENVGLLRSWLEEKGLAENTIFIFTTDNGTSIGQNVFNAGMRGHKGSEFDGGHKVPFFIHWPKGGFNKGLDINTLSAHIDVLPTLIDLCGLEAPRDYKFDGVSLAPLLKGEKLSWPDRTVITDSQRVRDPIMWRKSSVMTQRWRLINGKELYDIQADPGQKENVAKQFPEIIKKLRADYEACWADISPVFKIDTRIIIGNKAENPSFLTSHDWLTFDGTTPWNQDQIRLGIQGIGHWALKAEQAGAYRISLRRWPRGVDAAITAGIPAPHPVPGLNNRNQFPRKKGAPKDFNPGVCGEYPGKALNIKAAGIKIGDIEQDKPVIGQSQEVTFEVKLKKGEVNLLGYFILADGKKMGSYYAYVEKI